MRKIEREAYMTELRHAYKVFDGKPNEKRPTLSLRHIREIDI
jgi:hypothetical protein